MARLNKPHPIRDLKQSQTVQDIDDNFDAAFNGIKALDLQVQELKRLVATSATTSTTPTSLVTIVRGSGDGERGTNGPPGLKGATGATGATGAAGPATLGPMGLDDYIVEEIISPPGPQGPTGNPGATGPSEPLMMLGLDGMDGEDGMPIPGPPGSAGAGASLTFLKTTVQQTINAGASVFTDVTGLTFPVVNGNTYAFKFYVVWQSAVAATGQKSSVNCPNGTLDFFSTHQTVANSATVGVSTWLHRHSVTRDDLTTLASTTDAGVDHVTMFEGRYICTQDGTFAVRLANESASNTDITVEAGSWGYYWIQ